MSQTAFSLAAIGLGGNLGDAPATLAAALRALVASDCEVLAWSSLYRSAAIGPAGQPDYANAVAVVATTLSPDALLAHLQTIENRHGRMRLQRWGARTLDLDLLLYDHVQLQTAYLTIPHPELLNRNFVLLPLIEAWPNARLPDQRLLASLTERIRRDHLQRWPDTCWPDARRLGNLA